MAACPTAPRPYWIEEARRLRAEGMSLRQIGAVVHRSNASIWMALSGYKRKTYYKPVSEGGPSKAGVKQDHTRTKLRLAARQEAAQTGEDVEAVYARYGVATVDRAAVYDARRRA